LRVSIVHTEGNEVGAPAISPDGRRIAYRARRPDGMPMLWIRDLDTFDARPLPGTEDAYFPFWSPDLRQMGFSAGGFIKVIPAKGGPVKVIFAGTSVESGTWAADDTIVFRMGDRGLFRANAAAKGTATNMTRAVKPQGSDWGHYWPCFLPDGRHFLFTAKIWTSSAESSGPGIYIGTLDSPDKIRRLLSDLSSAIYAPPGYIVFARDGMLMAAPFDLETEHVGETKSLGIAVACESSYYLSAGRCQQMMRWRSAARSRIAVHMPKSNDDIEHDRAQETYSQWLSGFSEEEIAEFFKIDFIHARGLQ
jgi:hypothetical protein